MLPFTVTPSPCSGPRGASPLTSRTTCERARKRGLKRRIASCAALSLSIRAMLCQREVKSMHEAAAGHRQQELLLLVDAALGAAARGADPVRRDRAQVRREGRRADRAR